MAPRLAACRELSPGTSATLLPLSLVLLALMLISSSSALLHPRSCHLRVRSTFLVQVELTNGSGSCLARSGKRQNKKGVSHRLMAVTAAEPKASSCTVSWGPAPIAPRQPYAQ
eukprot:8460592-Pyramimonas_sp.AAC.1